MKKALSLFLIVSILLTPLSLIGCQPKEETENENQPARTVVELTEDNYWKYITVNSEAISVSAGGKGSISYEIKGVLDFALYEDVVFSFDVFYYTDGQKDDEYQSYTMRIACNAAGDASFETVYQGITLVTVGKWLGVDGELVSFENYNWKIHLKSVTGKVIYTA